MSEQQSRMDGVVKIAAGFLLLLLGAVGFTPWYQSLVATLPLPWMAGVEELSRLLFAQFAPAACELLGLAISAAGVYQYWTGKRPRNERSQVNDV